MLKRNVFSGLLVALFALTMIGGATAAPAKQPDFNVNVCVGQEFTITVPDYPWIEGEGDFSYDPKVLDYIGMTFIPPTSGLDGDFGTINYTFKAIDVGLTTVTIDGMDYTVQVLPPLNHIG